MESNSKNITILTNGIIYTVDGDDWDLHPEEAIAYDDNGIIVAVGAADVKQYVEDARLIDLGGRTVLPGFVDSHVHAPGTAFMEMFEAGLNGIHTKEETLSILKKFIDEHPDFDAYFAGGFDMSMRDEAGAEPCAAWLDEVCEDKPVIVKSYDMHSRWLNTKAMEKSQITDTAAVSFGHIHRDSEGRLTGLFTDCKELPIMEPVYTEQQHLEAIKAFMKKMNAWGYTSIMSIAPIMLFEPGRYLDLEKEGALTLRINAAQMILPADIDGCIDRLKTLRDEFEESGVRISTGKFLVDGVLEGKTACLKEPYAAEAGMGEDYCGTMNWKPETLADATTKALEAGFQTHYHCIGDAATTAALNAIEAAQKATGRSDLRNVITHLQVVDEADYKRFGELGVIASIQPFWHFKEPGWFENIEVSVIGRERAEREYPSASLAKAGAVLTASGDYPVSPSNNPFHGIQAGVTRNIYNEDFGRMIDDPNDTTYLLGPDERLSMRQMVEAYTINGAYELFREDEIGSITVGKKADFAVVDRDIFNISVLDVHNAKIETTIFNGKAIWEQSKA